MDATYNTSMGSSKAKPSLQQSSLISPFWVSLGFFGIQFAWALQMGQMSPLLEQLGSRPWLTSLIWAAGPVTGVLVQPIVGTWSDNLKHSLGRRRPFLIAGTLVTALVLVLMPNAAALGDSLRDAININGSFPYGLLIAAILLWLLDAGINLTQGPYRALVPDVFDESRQTKAFSSMSLTIGLGSIMAFLIAYAIDSMHLLFYLGAVTIVVAMGATVLKTPERSTAISDNEKAAIAKARADKSQAKPKSIKIEMSKDQWVLCLTHALTWFGIMCLNVFFAVFVPKYIFGAMDPGSIDYRQGVQWASLCFAMQNASCFMFSPFIDRLCRRFGKKGLHTATLLLMAISMGALFFVKQPVMVLLIMGLIGFGWATTLSVPYAMLTQKLSSKGQEGALMGWFNIFIAAPGLVCSLAVGPFISWSGQTEALAFLLGGSAIALGALLLQAYKEEPVKTQKPVPA